MVSCTRKSLSWGFIMRRLFQNRENLLSLVLRSIFAIRNWDLCDIAVSFEWSRVAFSRYGIKNKKSVGFSSGLKYFQSYLLRSFRSVCEGGRKAGLFPRVSVGNEVLRNTWLDLAFYDPCNVTRILRIWFPPSIFHRDQSMMRCLADWTSCCRYLCSSLLRSGEIKKRNKIYNPRYVAKWPIRFQRTRLHPLGGSDALTRSIFTLVDRFSKFFN